ALAVSVVLVAVACSDGRPQHLETSDGGVTTEAQSTTEPHGRNTASAVGVTATTIKVAVLAADLKGLVLAGAIRGIPEDAGAANALRVSSYLDKWNAAGGINGRTFEYEFISWDPAIEKSYLDMCRRVIEAKVFLVIESAGGAPAEAKRCLTDAGTQYLGIES